MALVSNETYEGKLAAVWLSEMFSGSPTYTMCVPIEDVKSKIKIPRLFTNDDLIQDATCDFDPETGMEWTPKELEVVELSVQSQICKSDLHGSSLERFLSAGSNPEIMDMTLSEKILLYLKQKLSEKVEQLLWQGNVATGVGFLNKMDGFLAKFVANGVNFMPAAGAITAANYETMMGNFITNLPDLLKEHAQDDDFYIYIPVHMRALHWAYVGNNNSFAGRGQDWTNMPMFFDGVKLKMLPGLPTSTIVASSWQNLYVGTDLVTDVGEIAIQDQWDNGLHKKVHIRGDFKLGCTEGISENVYAYKPA